MAHLAARLERVQGETPGASYVMFAGTGTPGTSEGIYAYTWEPRQGKLTSLGLAAKTPSPTFLALSPDKKSLIAANEITDFVDPVAGASAGSQAGLKAALKTGSLSSFRVDGPRLTPVNTVSSQGAGPCHVAVDLSGEAVFAANYAGGSAASFRLDSSGRLSQAVSAFHYQGHGADRDHQEAPHAHRATVSPENRYVFINDLGLDCLHAYHLDWASAKLTPAEPPQWNTAPGAGPRALRFHPTGRWAYCVNELNSTIDVLGWKPSTGQFFPLQNLSLVPKEFKGITRASEIVIDRSGRFAYAANRDNNFLATLSIDVLTGKLTLLDRSDCGGKTPRHIALDPTEEWVLVANQDSDLISAVPRDPKTGRLAPTSINTPLSKPMCVLFA